MVFLKPLQRSFFAPRRRRRWCRHRRPSAPPAARRSRPRPTSTTSRGDAAPRDAPRLTTLAGTVRRVFFDGSAWGACANRRCRDSFVRLEHGLVKRKKTLTVHCTSSQCNGFSRFSPPPDLPQDPQDHPPSRSSYASEPSRAMKSTSPFRRSLLALPRSPSNHGRPRNVLSCFFHPLLAVFAEKMPQARVIGLERSSEGARKLDYNLLLPGHL